MASITFKAKVSDRRIKVPKLTRAHCDMAAFRTHPKFGAFANSDLFQSVLARAVPLKFINLDSIPDNVTVDASGFLANVTIEV